jgi:chromate transporter
VAKNRWLGLLAAAALAAYLLGINELVVLVAGGVVAAVAHLLASRRPGHGALLAPLAVLFPDPTAGQLAQLFLTFLKIGSVLYGSGYVLLAFLEGDLVDRLGWVTQEQLVDAVSIGQVTPGPVFTTATFLGYLVAGLPGAFVATVGIFLPSFVFVGLLTRITNRLRSSAWTAAVLDGVNAASIALMAGVSWQLARASITDAAAVGIFVVTLVLLWRTRLNNAWYVAGGAVAGIGLGLSGLQ